MKKMGIPLRKTDKNYTYGDYKNWPEDERWEIIEGVAWNMSPAPSRKHQGLSTRFIEQILPYLKGKGCELYHAPFDVLLPKIDEQDEDDITTVVQPDISVICDKNKLTDKGCTGAPDWIIEILSPFTSRKDLVIKHNLYQRHGVREYWVVDPGNNYIHVYRLDDSGAYSEEPEIFLKEDTVSCQVLEGLTINLDEIFS
jgi:Uma2 family endonuclease